MKKLLPYLKQYRKECVLGPLFKLLEATFELFIPLIVAQIIDQGIPNGDMSFVKQRVLMMAALGLIGMLAAISAQYFAARAAVGFAATLREKLFAHIQELSFESTSQIGSSTLITRMTADINQIQTALNLGLRLLLRSPFIVFGSAVMAFTVDAEAAFPFVIVIPLLALIVFGILFMSNPLNKKVRSALDGLLCLTRQNLSGVRVIRAFGRESHEVETFDGENSRLTAMQLQVGKLSALLNPLTYVVLNAGTIALIRRGAVKVNLGGLSQGSVVALVNYMSQISVEMIKMANLFISISKSLPCASRVSDVLDMPVGQELHPTDEIHPDEVLAFDHVDLIYPGAGETALNDICFSIRPGETLGIIGGTGSGKSSVVNLIPRFFDATRGEVRVFGKNVRSIPDEELRAGIGLVPQKAVLFKGTVRDNLLLSDPSADDETCLKALEIAQAADFIREKGGPDAAVEQNGRNFSGGQRQRLTIARALVRNPRILILDDSSSALDYATDARLRQAIRGMDPEMTVVIVSQRTASIRYADHILVLDDGQQVGFGTHDELMETCTVYREIYESQFSKEGSDGK